MSFKSLVKSVGWAFDFFLANLVEENPTLILNNEVLKVIRQPDLSLNFFSISESTPKKQSKPATVLPETTPIYLSISSRPTCFVHANEETLSDKFQFDFQLREEPKIRRSECRLKLERRKTVHFRIERIGLTMINIDDHLIQQPFGNYLLIHQFFKGKISKEFFCRWVRLAWKLKESLLNSLVKSVGTDHAP